MTTFFGGSPRGHCQASVACPEAVRHRRNACAITDVHSSRSIVGVKSYLGALAMAAGATVLALMIGAPVPSRTPLPSPAFPLLPIVACSWLTTFLFPSVLIAGVVTFCLRLSLLVLIYVPLG